MLVIALTGGIGSGKSTVAQQFSQLGIPVIDTDIIARELVEQGKPAYLEIVNAFSEAILDDKKNIDREYLRKEIFSDQEKRIQLENILHPLIWHEVLAQISTLKTRGNIPYCIVVVPLLFETENSYKELITFDRVLVIDVPESIQLRRAQQRDNSGEDLIKKIMQNQVSRQKRIKRADDIIDNTRSLESLRLEAESLHQFYLQLLNK